MIKSIIDEYVPLDPRRKTLTHGEAALAMITGIIFQVPQLYHLCPWAEKTSILDVILPGIAFREYFDDRMADTLDAIFAHGIGNLELLITRGMIARFQIESPICHNDTTSISTYGDCANNKTDQSIHIDFGFSKKHRQDLKQLIWSLSVSSDSGFPLFQKAYSGNTADVDTYVEQWHNPVDLLGHRDFLYVADSKLITRGNMAHIQDKEGFFIAPAPMYESYKKIFHQALAGHGHEILIPYKDQFNQGFEVPLAITHEARDYLFRMIILFDHGVAASKRHGLDKQVMQTRAAFDELSGKLNKFKLKTEKKIDEACRAILKKHQTEDFFSYQIHNQPITTLKNKKRGRVGKNSEKVSVTRDHFKVVFEFNRQAFEEEYNRCGYYPLITNMPEDALSIESAMLAHKDQYKCEHLNRRSKSGFNLEPIYLHTPERIEAFLFLFKIALQIIVLIERAVRKKIVARNKGLDNFMPNRKDVRNPLTENLLAAFREVVCGQIAIPDGKTYVFISKLTELQKDIIGLLGI